MKKQFPIPAVAFIVICTMVVTTHTAMAQNCSSPPTGSYGPAWARQYQSWCEACNGKFSMSGGNPSCTPGPNWGGRGGSSSGGAAAGLAQPFYNLGYNFGQSLGKALFGDPQEEARKRAEQQMQTAEQAQAAEAARQMAEVEARIRAAEEAHKKQETFDRLSTQIQLSEGFDGQKSDGPALMLGDSDSGLRPQGTSFFGTGGGAGGSSAGVNNDSRVVDLRPRQGYSATTAAAPGDNLALIMGDPNEASRQAPITDSKVVDLRDKKAPYVVDPNVVKGRTNTQGAQARMQADAVISGIYAQAKRLGWSAKKLERLDKALNGLDLADDSIVTGTQINEAWQNIFARAQDRKLAQEASRGEGTRMPGAGKQTRYNDCTIFALANAAGLPYGVVAARAAEIIREGEWRSAEDRANPQKAIEKGGLIGGEVIMEAEAFGRAEVVPPSGFASMLKEGRPVLVNVAHNTGSSLVGHEVVLTKAFLHGGETWYEMMDANDGPLQRRYLSDKELNTLILENGVAFSPEPGTVPKLLRKK